MSRPGTRGLANTGLALLLLIAGNLAFAANADKELKLWQDAAQWRTVLPEELAMTGESRAPGASAIYLYTLRERSDARFRDLDYRQIKVLTEEGRNLANIGINYNKQTETILRIDARVIQPDGTIVPFNGTIYDRPLAANRSLSWHAKSFTLPDVRVGSVIEYRFWRTFTGLSSTRWLLNQDLFTRHARFSLELGDVPFAVAQWSWPQGLPEGVSPPLRDAKNTVSMEVRNTPAFVIEDYMPPPDDLILAVKFGYFGAGRKTDDPAKYWRTFGGGRWESIERFIGQPKDVRKNLEAIIAEGGTSEQKLRKIYDHVRLMPNIDASVPLDQKVLRRCKRENLNVRGVAKAGCGDTAELQMYFIALARAAGLTADPVLIASRGERFFTPDTMDSSQLDGWLVAVNLDGRELFLSPGISVLPFGALLWAQTAVPGLKLNKIDSQWLTTPSPGPADAITRRKAKFTLSEDGELEGTVIVSHSGHDAIARLLGLSLSDEQSRIDVLKEDLRQSLAVPADIKVLRQPDWQAREGVIETEYQVKVPQWAVTSGNRLMVGIGLFGAEQVGKFVTPRREHPIYFAYPFTTEDELEIALPAGFRLQDAPARQVSPDNALKYVTAVQFRDGAIRIRRTLTHNVLLAKQSQYPRFRSFYELVRTGDQEQVVLVR